MKAAILLCMFASLLLATEAQWWGGYGGWGYPYYGGYGLGYGYGGYGWGGWPYWGGYGGWGGWYGKKKREAGLEMNAENAGASNAAESMNLHEMLKRAAEANQQ